jgi:hypothetical protein
MPYLMSYIAEKYTINHSDGYIFLDYIGLEPGSDGKQ